MDLTVENTTDYEPVHNVAGNGVATAAPGPPLDVGSLAIGAMVAIDTGDAHAPVGRITALDAQVGVAMVAMRDEDTAGGHAASRAVPYARLRQTAE